MGFTVRCDESLPQTLRAYLQSLEVTALMNLYNKDSVMATNLAKKPNDEPIWVIGPIDEEPLYSLERTSTQDQRLHHYKATPLVRAPRNYYSR